MELQNTTLDDISAVIGFSATVRLSAWFGDGDSLYVPETLYDDQPLVKLIGMSAAKALSKEWGNQLLSLPRLRSYEDDLRKQQVGRMTEKQFGAREIARYLRIGERRVQQILRELQQDGLIGDMRRNNGKKASRIAPEKGPAHLPPGFFGSAAAPKPPSEPKVGKA